jgi:hypothetical protein
LAQNRRLHSNLMTRLGEWVQRCGFLALRSAFDGSSVTNTSLPSFSNPISSLG